MAYSFDELTKGFKNPPIDFSPAPLWVWNERMTNDLIDFQMQEFKNTGTNMVFIHPRPGLITEYLSNEWFELVKHTVDKARELDMKVWLYDENSYPSGFAGGHVPAATFATSDPIAGLQLKKLEVLDEKDTTSYMLVIKQMGNALTNITNNRDKYYGKSGTYYAFTKWYYPKGEGWYGGFSYVDLLAYGITEKFMKVTMDGYEEYIGNEFGKLVPGIFTDEPNINTIGGPNTVVRFTPVLFNRFEKKYGYQLQSYLPCLYDEVGDWKNVRHDYHALLLEMFTERWSQPWEKYTNEKNMKWTGHYWEHGWPNPEHGPDNMAMYAYHQYPGIDMLFNSDDIPEQFGNIRAVKELSSVANQLDKDRSLSETYGGSGWELTFADMKRQGDWEFVLGVNFMNPHLAHGTLKGARKRDYPQSFSYHTPYWDNINPLNEYFHRLSFALSAGEQMNRILVLEPTSTGWMLNSTIEGRDPNSEPRQIDLLKESFHELLTKLEKNQVEYDLGCEDIMKDHGAVTDAGLVIGSRVYELVVLPPMTQNLMMPTYKLLTEYLNQGGKVISLSKAPERIDGNVTSAVAKLFDQYASQITVAESIDQSIIEGQLRSSGFVPQNPESWRGNVLHQRRILKDGQLMFFINYDKVETANIDFSAKGKSVAEFDLLGGEYALLPAVSENGMISMQFSLLPGESKLLYFGKGNLKGEYINPPPDAALKSLQSSATTITKLSPNTLTLDYCDLSVAGKQYKDIYFCNAADTVFKVYLKEKNSPKYNPWSNAVQYRTRILDKNTFDENSGFEATFHFNLVDGFVPSSLKAVAESPQLYKISINGQLVQFSGEWWLDKDFGVYDISKHLVSGKNAMTITASPMDILAELEPVYLVGDFNLEPEEKGWKLIPPTEVALGSWKSQGLPYYSDKMVYSKTVEKPGDSRVFVQMKEWSGTVAEVLVNGESAGIISWQPNRLEISDKLKNGQNTIEVIVTGSLKNLMGPHHSDPRKGLVSPWSFFYAPEHQPAGSEYDLLDYGLIEDFEVVSY